MSRHKKSEGLTPASGNFHLISVLWADIILWVNTLRRHQRLYLPLTKHQLRATFKLGWIHINRPQNALTHPVIQGWAANIQQFQSLFGVQQLI